DGSTVWAFGDGDYGKLGLGNSTAKSSPQKVDVLCGLGIKKVACGTQFSVALTKDGNVYSFGQRLIGLPEGRARNHNRPQQIPAFTGVFILDVAVGGGAFPRSLVHGGRLRLGEQLRGTAVF
uniref:Uncharacterized protein n=1 Tax=Astyanax mexicanus TaxID=7994 RepID=A0A3B1JG71_ASTMX